MTITDTRPTLPATIGQTIEFTAHGQTFRVKKKRAALYVMFQDGNQSRSRWGNAADISNDIAHAVEFGTLPRPAGEHW